MIRVVLALLLLLCGVAVAQNQLRCSSRLGMLAFLYDKYGEEPTGIGQIGPDIAIELTLASAGSFTILQSQADGEKTCMLISGTNWTVTADRPLPGKPT